MKKLPFFFLLLSLPCLFLGCKTSQAAPKIRVVTAITVTATGSEHTVTRTYTRDKNMSYVLNYLRLLDPYVPVSLSPDTFRTDTYQITVYYSDGNRSQYNQIYHDYFQMSDGPWKRIDPQMGSRLQRIIDELEEDI